MKRPLPDWQLWALLILTAPFWVPWVICVVTVYSVSGWCATGWQEVRKGWRFQFWRSPWTEAYLVTPWGAVAVKRRRNMLFTERNGLTPCYVLGPICVVWDRAAALPPRQPQEDDLDW